MRRRTVLRGVAAGLGSLATGGDVVSAGVDGRNPAWTGWKRSTAYREVARWRPWDLGSAWAELWSPGLVLHDVTVHDGYAYCAYWDAGTWILDVSDPSTPTAVGRAGHYSRQELAELLADDARRPEALIEAPGNAHHADVNEAGTLIGVGSEGWDAPRTEARGPGGIRLFDVREKSRPERLARIAPPRAEDETWGGTWVTAHNFEFQGDRLYSSWYQGGVMVHDVADPSNPELRSWWVDPEVARFWTAQPAVPGEFFVASSFLKDGTADRLYVFPDRPGRQPGSPPLEYERPPPADEPFEPMGTVDVPGATEAVVADDGRTAYVATGEGFAVVDLQDPTDPTVVATRENLLADREHGPMEALQDLAIDGDRLVIAGPAQSRLLRGFLTFDVSDPRDPTRVGFYETEFNVHNVELSAGHVYLTGNGEPGNPLVIVDVRSATDSEETGGTTVTTARSSTATPSTITEATPSTPADDGNEDPDTGTTGTGAATPQGESGGSTTSSRQLPTHGFGGLAAVGGLGLALAIRRHLDRSESD